MPKKLTDTKRILNRRARHDYAIGDSLIVGMVLSGPETKSLRMGHGQLRGSYVTIKDNELWLVNFTISGTRGIPISESDQTRSRKLLAKEREIRSLEAARQQGNTIIPLEVIIKGRYIKLKVAVARGKKLYDKRQTNREREQKRHIDEVLKYRNKQA